MIDPAIFPQEYPFMVQALRNPITRALTSMFTSPEYRTRFALRRLFAPSNYHRITDAQVAKYAFFLHREHAARAIVDVSMQIDETDPTALMKNLARITIPTLLVWGRHDPVISVENADRLAEYIPNAEVEIIEDAGHAPHEECPEYTAQLVSDFCKRSSR